MVRVTLKKRDEDKIQGNGRYWIPQTVGDELEGTIESIYPDDYDNERCIIITPDGDEKETPAHKDFLEYMPQLREGDYVWITCTGIEEKTFERGPKKGQKFNVCTYQVDIDEQEQEEL